MGRAKLDRGHGGNTWPPSKGIAASGGVPGMAEHSFNAAVMDEAERLLKGKVATFSAQGSNKSDVSLSTRIRLYNAEHKKDTTGIGISGHGNASGDKNVRGFGVFYWKGSTEGKKLAKMILAEYKAEFPGFPIWGDGLFESQVGSWTNFAILRETLGPWILVEFEFFTNDAARKLMLTSDYRKRCGSVVAKTVARWHGTALAGTAAKPAAVKQTAGDPINKGWLQIRDHGLSVGTLQSDLNEFAQLLNRTPLVVDTHFGQLTVEFLKDWQQHFNLKSDGYYGAASIAMMKKQLQALQTAANKAKAAALAKAQKDAAAKPGAAKYRVLVDGKQTGAYALGDNAIQEAERAIDAGAENIEIKEI